MKVRVLFYTVMLVVVGSMIALLLYRRPMQPLPALPEMAQQSNQNSNSVALVRPRLPVATPPVATAPSAWTVAKQDSVKREAIIRQAVEDNNAPIDFYGEVVDQNSNGIADVHVEVAIRQWVTQSNTVEGNIIHLDEATDGTGHLEIHNQTGDGFDVESVQKAGYMLSPKSPNHFGPASGSYQNPAILSMWKIGEKAQLTGGSKFWGIVPDGRVYTIDLFLATKSELVNADGDLKISVSRPSGAAREDHYDWSYTIASVDGGVIETADDFLYQAPENGYAPEYDFHLNKSDDKWTDRIKKSFYIRTRGGKYGNMTLEVFAHYQDAAVLKIDWAVNPDGSRNLQP